MFFHPPFFCVGPSPFFTGLKKHGKEKPKTDSSIATLDSQKECNNLFDHLNRDGSQVMQGSYWR